MHAVRRPCLQTCELDKDKDKHIQLDHDASAVTRASLADASRCRPHR
jgi:hypothetical protein